MANAAPHEQAQLMLKQINPESWPICIDQLPDGTALVGGAVRDAFLGRHSQHPDLDLVVPSDALRHTARLAKTFGGKRVVLDEQRDIARLVLKGWTIDLARQEGHCLEDDLWRRDYSLNAIALPLRPLAPLCDPTGGIDDLKRGRLRAVREQNLIDDPLRLLRGLRLLAEIPLVLDTETGEWIQRHRQALVESAPERILAELQRLVKGTHADHSLHLLKRWQLLQPWGTTPQTLSKHDTTLLRAAEVAVALPLARLTNLISDDGLKRLKASKVLQQRCARLRHWILQAKQQPEALPEQERLQLHLELEADLAALILGLPMELQPQWLKRWRDPNDRLFHPTMPLDGGSLQRELGLSAGPTMGKVLAQLRLEQAFGRIQNHDEAVQTARRLCAEIEPVCD
jgi:tRNA nucleotidyltransferase (CCA-adding enzyme)